MVTATVVRLTSTIVGHTVAGDRVATYLGLRRAPNSKTRSSVERVMTPGPDSARTELRTSLVLGLILTATFSAGLVKAAGWFVVLDAVYVFLSLRMCLAGRWLRKPVS